MANIKLILKEDKRSKTTESKIYISYYQNAQNKALLSTGVTAKASNWNKDKGQVRKTDPLHQEKNEILHSRLQRILTIEKELSLRDEEVTIHKLKELYDIKHKGTSGIKDPVEAIELMIERKKGLVKDDVLKDYRSLAKHMKSFIQKESKHATINDIDNRFGSSFQQYLTVTDIVPYRDQTDQTLKYRPMAKNTIGKQLKNLKVLMRFCLDEGLIKNNQLTKLSPPSEVSDDIALSEVELQKIEALELEAGSKHDEIRDFFLIGCETGLRYSDLKRLSSANLDLEQRILTIRTQKSNKPVKIPVSLRVKRILDKRLGRFPKSYNSVSFNVEIKEISKESGLLDSVVKTTTRGNEINEKAIPKWQMVSSHTCRRTFCTIQFKSGMPTILIRRISGHAKESDFLRYIKIGEEEAAEMMLDFWAKQNKLR